MFAVRYSNIVVYWRPKSNRIINELNYQFTKIRDTITRRHIWDVNSHMEFWVRIRVLLYITTTKYKTVHWSCLNTPKNTQAPFTHISKDIVLLWLYPSHLIPSNRRLWDNREKYGCIRTDICVWDCWGLMKKHSGLVGSDLFTSSDTEWHFHLSSALIGRSASTLIFRARLPYRHTHTHTL